MHLVLMYVVYWRCIIYYKNLIIHNGMARQFRRCVQLRKIGLKKPVAIECYRIGHSTQITRQMYRISQRGQRSLRSEQCLTPGLNFGVWNPGRGICSALFRAYSGECLSKIPLLFVGMHLYSLGNKTSH